MDVSVLTTLKLICKPTELVHLERVRRHIYSTLSKLHVEVAATREPVPYEERKSLEYRTIRCGQAWAEQLYDCAWFHCTGKLNCPLPESAVGIFDWGGEGCVFDDNGVVQGLTSILSQVDVFQSRRGKKVVDAKKLNIDEDGNVDVWVDAGWNGINGFAPLDARFKEASIAEMRKDVFAYYYDYWTLYQYATVAEKKEAREVESALRTARRLLDGFSREGVAAARAALAHFFAGGNTNPMEVTAVGHAHLDLAWMWPMRETKRKAERTYSNALANIETNPEYIFGSSQPQQFEWMKERRPALYARIKDAVAAGNVEVQGCMWVEPDINLPCGESLIRQCYYGKRFFKEEFGKDMDYLWVPDVFGYSASLPRILRGCGVDKFMTIKLSWNTVNKFPHHSFVWKGIGEGDVLVHMPPEGNYNSCATPFCLKYIAKEYREKDVSKVALMPFGCGDGGGGPGEFHVNVAERESKLSLSGLPRVTLGTAESFFEKLAKEKDKLPTYEGELYLEKHQGTYTTQGVMKRDMRHAEVLLHNAEYLCTAAALRGGKYPLSTLDKLWKNVLLHQFHDILPGSSITRVYQEAHAVFAAQEKVLDAIAEKAVGALPKAEGQTIINATSFDRNGYVKTENGWKAYSAKPYASAAVGEVSAPPCTAQNGVLENALVRICFEPSGEISELVEKASGENFAAGKLNTMTVYRDKNMVPYGAWDIDSEYMKKPSKRMTLTASKEWVEDGVAIREQTLEYGFSKLVQRIVLYPDTPVVYVENHADWREDCKMLRADFRPAHYSKTVKCDIQMGSFDRSTEEDTSVRRAQFEICAHKWVDVSDEKGGVAILNDCKYGHRAKNGIISLNLLRSTVHPDKTADRGEHDFTFAIYPHSGEALQSDLVKYAYFLNNPVLSSDVDVPSLAAVDTDDVVVETVFTTEKGEVAVRLYETKGQTAACALSAGFDFASVRETNLLFENGEDVDISALKFTPFEIKTIVFTLKNPIAVV